MQCQYLARSMYYVFYKESRRPAGWFEMLNTNQVKYPFVCIQVDFNLDSFTRLLFNIPKPACRSTRMGANGFVMRGEPHPFLISTNQNRLSCISSASRVY